MMKVKTRFAPSPTGFLHIGGVRTALFSWLFARHHGGQFVLRIEDTDRERSTQESIDAILEGLKWVGLDWDEGPHFQSQRLDRYRKLAEQLLEQGKAYHCYCSTDELDAMRAAQTAAGENPRYDGRCRERTEPVTGVSPVIRFKTPLTGEVTIDDAVHGRVVYANAELDDLVIMRANGVATYHFCVVVDDADMDITHVIRGDDHLNNTARQVHIIAALGYDRPAYAHLPMILGEDGARLSKRHGAVNVLDYREQGYLPDALLNYLVRLGWSHGDQEIFSRDEMIELFALDDVNASASRFSMEKLRWLNQQYILQTPPDELVDGLAEQYGRLAVDTSDGPALKVVIEVFQERATTLQELAESSVYVFRDFAEIEPKAVKKHLRPVVRQPLADVRESLADLETWAAEAIQRIIQAVAEQHELGFGKLGQPLRVAVTGGSVSPPIDVTMMLIGRKRCLVRIDAALSIIDERIAAAAR